MQSRKSFLVLFFKKEQEKEGFFGKKNEKTFSGLAGVRRGRCGVWRESSVYGAGRLVGRFGYKGLPGPETWKISKLVVGRRAGTAGANP
jgi:hypothetical protein